MKYLLLILCLFISACGKPPYLKKSAYLNSNNHDTLLFFEISNIVLEINWQTPISTTDSATAILKVSQNGVPKPLPLNSLIYLWMPSMGHGSSDITIKEIASGVYELSDIYFIMNGDWQLRFDFPLNASTIETRYFEYLL